jgi:hypothetical protein
MFVEFPDSMYRFGLICAISLIVSFTVGLNYFYEHQPVFTYTFKNAIHSLHQSTNDATQVNSEWANDYALCNKSSVAKDLTCLLLHVKKRIPRGSSLMVVQTNKAFTEMTINLVCSAERIGIPRTQFLMWSMDPASHSSMMEQGLLSYHNPVVFYGSENAEYYQYLS